MQVRRVGGEHAKPVVVRRVVSVSHRVAQQEARKAAARRHVVPRVRGAAQVEARPLGAARHDEVAVVRGAAARLDGHPLVASVPEHQRVAQQVARRAHVEAAGPRAAGVLAAHALHVVQHGARLDGRDQRRAVERRRPHAQRRVAQHDALKHHLRRGAPVGRRTRLPRLRIVAVRELGEDATQLERQVARQRLHAALVRPVRALVEHQAVAVEEPLAGAVERPRRVVVALHPGGNDAVVVEGWPRLAPAEHLEEEHVAPHVDGRHVEGCRADLDRLREQPDLRVHLQRAALTVLLGDPEVRREEPVLEPNHRGERAVGSHHGSQASDDGFFHVVHVDAGRHHELIAHLPAYGTLHHQLASARLRGEVEPRPGRPLEAMQLQVAEYHQPVGEPPHHRGMRGLVVREQHEREAAGVRHLGRATEQLAARPHQHKGGA